MSGSNTPLVVVACNPPSGPQPGGRVVQLSGRWPASMKPGMQPPGWHFWYDEQGTPWACFPGRLVAAELDLSSGTVGPPIDISQFVAIAGNANTPMTGPLLLVGPATAPTQAVPLQQLTQLLAAVNITVNPPVLGTTNLQAALDALANAAAAAMVQFSGDVAGAFTPSQIAGATVTLAGDLSGSATDATGDANSVALEGDIST